MKKGEIVAIFVILICIFSGIYFTKNKNENDENYYNYEKDIVLSDDTSSDSDTSSENVVNTLRKKYDNNDIVAELRIGNTNFKTPIPQSTDNNYYYRRLPNKKHSIIGSTYLDYRTKINRDRVLIIYGHNSLKYNLPFKILENYYDEDYQKDHKYIELITENEVKLYEVFSVFVETNDYSYYTDIEFSSNDEFYRHITKLKNKSFYNTNVELSKNDNILILQACSTHEKYKKYKRKFVLIISREFKEYENN